MTKTEHLKRRISYKDNYLKLVLKRQKQGLTSLAAAAAEVNDGLSHFGSEIFRCQISQLYMYTF